MQLHDGLPRVLSLGLSSCPHRHFPILLSLPVPQPSHSLNLGTPGGVWSAIVGPHCCGSPRPAPVWTSGSILIPPWLLKPLPLLRTPNNVPRLLSSLEAASICVAGSRAAPASQLYSMGPILSSEWRCPPPRPLSTDSIFPCMWATVLDAPTSSVCHAAL